MLKSDRRTYVEGEPTPARSEKNFRVLPLAKVPAEISQARLRNIGYHNGGVRVDFFALIVDDILDICCGLCDVTLDIHRKAGGFWDSKTEVKRDNTGNTTEADEDTPDVVNVVELCGGVVYDFILVCSHRNQADYSSS